MKKKTLFVLTIVTDEYEVFVHLFKHFDNAVQYVLNRLGGDTEEAKESLKDSSCWTDENNTEYNIDEHEIEDDGE